jgi:hypothetical protein
VDLPPDFKDRLAEFARCGVEAVLVGAYVVANKRAVGRPQDLIDAAFLERVRAFQAKPR